MTDYLAPCKNCYTVNGTGTVWGEDVLGTICRFPLTEKVPSSNIQRFLYSESEREWNGPFTFVHAADPQLGLIDKYILRKSKPHWEPEKTLLSLFIRRVNELMPKPRFVVIGGDMVDTAPVGLSSEATSIHMEQYSDLIKTLGLLDPDIKLIFVCGNHDVGDKMTEDTLRLYRKEYGPDYFNFWVGGVRFSVLNSQYYKCNGSIHKRLFNVHEHFIKDGCGRSGVHNVAFQHYPLFAYHPEEEDVEWVNFNYEQRHQVLNMFVRNGISHLFSGHWHRNSIGTYFSPKGYRIEQVVTSAIGASFDNIPSGFRLVSVNRDEITHEYVTIFPKGTQPSYDEL